MEANRIKLLFGGKKIDSSYSECSLEIIGIDIWG